MSSAAGLDLGRFLGWWLGELRACLPRPLEAALFPAPARIFVDVGAAEAQISLARGGQDQPLGGLTFVGADDARIAADTAALLRQGGAARAPATLRLPTAQILRPVLDLPVLAAENLREVLELEMDRHTPFSADEVYFDFRVAGSDVELQRISVQVTAARRDDVRRAVSLARTMGLTPDCVTGAGASEANLLPDAERPKPSALPGRLIAGMAAVTVALAVAAALVSAGRDRARLEALDARLSALRVSAGEASALEAEVEMLRDVAGRVVEERRRRPQSVEIMDEVTRLLPDEHWLFSYTVSDDRLSLAGYSDDPSRALRLLEQSPLLSEAAFSAPVTMDPNLGKERFNLKAVVAREGGGE